MDNHSSSGARKIKPSKNGTDCTLLFNFAANWFTGMTTKVNELSELNGLVSPSSPILKIIPRPFRENWFQKINCFAEFLCQNITPKKSSRLAVFSPSLDIHDKFICQPLTSADALYYFCTKTLFNVLASSDRVLVRIGA